MGTTPQSPPPMPPYDARSWRVQQRAALAAAKAQRRAARQQVRAMRRRGSIVGPLLLLALGVFFLLAQMGRLNWSRSVDWLGAWWPSVLIVAGVILLGEWALEQRRASAAAATGALVAGSRGLGGGVVFLLILVAIAGLSSRAAQRSAAWRDRAFGPGAIGLDQLFGAQHDAYGELASAMAAGGVLTLRNPHGDITVTGASTDGQVHVSVHKRAYGWSREALDQVFAQLEPSVRTSGGSVQVAANSTDRGEADWTVTAPEGTAVQVMAGHGDVSVSGVRAAVTVSAGHGDVELSEITGPVTVTVSDDDADLTLDRIEGPISVQGRSGDVDITSASEEVSLRGDFYGTTHLSHVGGAVHFDTSRTHFSAARLDELSVDGDSLDATAVQGPVVLETEDKNLTLDRVAGSVEVTDKNGSVELTEVPGLGSVVIRNSHGSVDLGLPAGSGFHVNATTHDGKIEDDFGLPTPGESGGTTVQTVQGTVLGGGPAVSVETSDGDITLRKTTLAPLAAVAPKAGAAGSTAAGAAAGGEKIRRVPKAEGSHVVSGTTF